METRKPKHRRSSPFLSVEKNNGQFEKPRPHPSHDRSFDGVLVVLRGVSDDMPLLIFKDQLSLSNYELVGWLVGNHGNVSPTFFWFVWFSTIYKLSGGFKDLLFSPYLGKIPILTHIFQRS